MDFLFSIASKNYPKSIKLIPIHMSKITFFIQIVYLQIQHFSTLFIGISWIPPMFQYTPYILKNVSIIILPVSTCIFYNILSATGYEITINLEEMFAMASSWKFSIDKTFEVKNIKW